MVVKRPHVLFSLVKNIRNYQAIAPLTNDTVVRNKYAFTSVVNAAWLKQGWTIAVSILFTTFRKN